MAFTSNNSYHKRFSSIRGEGPQMKDPNKPKKRLRVVMWLCDKPNCRHANSRTVAFGDVINDDVCDKCKLNIHEPITKVIPAKHD